MSLLHLVPSASPPPGSTSLSQLSSSTLRTPPIYQNHLGKRFSDFLLMRQEKAAAGGDDSDGHGVLGIKESIRERMKEKIREAIRERIRK